MEAFCQSSETLLSGGLLYTKNANNRTLHPRTMCNVTQSQGDNDQGGDLGDRNYDVVRSKRTRGQVLDSRDRLREAGIGSSAAAELSRKLEGTQPAATDGPSALYDLVSLHQPMDSCCRELLHQNHLVSSRQPNETNTYFRGKC